MNLLDNVLLPCEEIKNRYKMHIVTLLPSFLMLGVGYILIKVTLMFGWPVIIHWIVGFATIYGLISFSHGVLVRYSSEFCITDSRVLVVTGIFNKRIADMEISEIDSIEINQSELGSFCNYGDLILTTIEKEKLLVPYVSDLESFKNELFEAIKELKKQDA